MFRELPAVHLSPQVLKLLPWNPAELLAFMLRTLVSQARLLYLFCLTVFGLVCQIILWFALKQAAGLLTERHPGLPSSGRFPRLCHSRTRALPFFFQSRSGKQGLLWAATPSVRQEALGMLEGEIKVDLKAPNHPTSPKHASMAQTRLLPRTRLRHRPGCWVELAHAGESREVSTGFHLRFTSFNS